MHVATATTHARICTQDNYGGLPFKVLTFLRTIVQQYNMTYIFKVDDDIFLRTDRVLPVVRQYAREGVGMCFGGDF